MTRLCTICARCGSRGVAGKNLRRLVDRPLIAHTIGQARASGLFAAIAVSSDSRDILDAAADAGVDHLVDRPPELATDRAPKLPAIEHCLRQVEQVRGAEFDVLVDLDATSPLRLPEDIAGAVALLEATGASNVITGARARRSPYFNLVEQAADGTIGLCKTLPAPVVRRQDAPICFDMNASIYVWRAAAFRASPAVFAADTRLYEMPEERSIDIDSELDFQIVEMLMERRLRGTGASR